MKQLFTLIFSILIGTGTMAQTVGQLAPDFTLKTLSNQNYTLSENRGKVILVFLVGHGCPFCIASAPTVNSAIVSQFNSNPNFQFLVIDTWNGSASAFQNFRNSTNLPGVYLQKGGDVATNWTITYDRLVVIDSEGKMAYKGKSAAGSDVEPAKREVEKALENLVTSASGLQSDDQFWTGQNYPNPFANSTEIIFNLPEAEKVIFRISDISGKEVVKKIVRHFPVGKNKLQINGDELHPGVYFYRLETESGSATGKMLVQ